MSESGKLYRVRDPNAGERFGRFVFTEPIPISRLVDFAATREGKAPDNPHNPTVRYYCHGEDCDVRTVDVTCKYLWGKAPKGPPEAKCPACGGPLEALAYVVHVPLERAD